MEDQQKESQSSRRRLIFAIGALARISHEPTGVIIING